MDYHLVRYNEFIYERCLGGKDHRESFPKHSNGTAKE